MKVTIEGDRETAVAIVGPTASGKTGVGILLAEALGTEIIGVDSRQVYRLLDIGTAKPTAGQVRRVPHHLVDFIDPDEPFNAGEYRKNVFRLLDRFEEKGQVPLFVGGTGLYLKAVLDGLCPAPAADGKLRSWLEKASGFPAGGLHTLLKRIDPRASEKIHPNDSQRLTRALEVYYLTGETLSSRQSRHRLAGPSFRAVVIGITRSQEELKKRIARRLDEMFAAGFADEVSSLLEAGYDPSLPALRAVGYPQMIAHLRGEAGLEETAEKIRRATWQYARRQMTWFRGVEGITWFGEKESLDDGALAGRILGLLSREGVPSPG